MSGYVVLVLVFFAHGGAYNSTPAITTANVRFDNMDLCRSAAETFKSVAHIESATCIRAGNQ